LGAAGVSFLTPPHTPTPRYTHPCGMGKTTKWILSVLVHEATHLWQHHYSRVKKEKRRTTYHDQEWADKMKSIGLQPSNTGSPGGNETGYSMSHYIVQGGLFSTTCDAFLASNDVPLYLELAGRASTRKDSGKNKFSCPVCNGNAWAAKSMMLICKKCNSEMILQNG